MFFFVYPNLTMYLTVDNLVVNIKILTPLFNGVKWSFRDAFTRRQMATEDIDIVIVLTF
jgi:hypothetical protein